MTNIHYWIILNINWLDKKGEITDAPQYRPALSIKESEKLLESLDTMSDEEVAAVLAKLKAAVGDRIKSKQLFPIVCL